MIWAILAAAVAATEPSEAAPTPVDPPAAAAPAQPSAAEQLLQLQRIYSQSCSERAYGSFNDMCDQMRRRLRDAERAARRADRKR